MKRKYHGITVVRKGIRKHVGAWLDIETHNRVLNNLQLFVGNGWKLLVEDKDTHCVTEAHSN